MLGYALRRTRSAEDAADVVSETFLTAWRRLDDLISDGDARLWLYGIARRVLANHQRGRRRSLQLLERLRRDVARSMETVVSEPAGLEAVSQALGGLREADREILGLAAWEELSGQELATVLRCSPNAAKIRLHRARKRLARRLAEDDVEMKPEEVTGHEPGGWDGHAR